MTYLVALLRPRRPGWPTLLVVGSVLALGLSLALSATGLVAPLVTTVTALLGGTGFVLGVSASISAFFQRDAYADSDFYR